MPSKNYKKRFEKRAKMVEEGIAKSMIKATLQIHKDLVIDTPVDTAWASTNWIINIGSAFVGTVGSKKAVDHASHVSGLVKVMGYKLRMGPIHITNNVPYIGLLNDGTSTQAPAGFVEKAVQKGIRLIRTVKVVEGKIL